MDGDSFSVYAYVTCVRKRETMQLFPISQINFLRILHRANRQDLRDRELRVETLSESCLENFPADLKVSSSR